MPSLQPKLLFIGDNTAANVYTVSSNTGSYAIVKNINICNRSNTATTCNVHILSASATPVNNNAIMSGFVVNAKETISYDSSIVLPAGHKIHVVNPSNLITFTISGVEYIT